MGQRFNAPRMAVETWPTYIKTTTNQPPTVSHQASFSFSGLKMRSITATKSSRNSANSTIYPFNKLRKVALFKKELRDFTDSLRDIHNKTDKIPDFMLFVLRCTLFRRILLVLVSARLVNGTGGKIAIAAWPWPISSFWSGLFIRISPLYDDGVTFCRCRYPWRKSTKTKLLLTRIIINKVKNSF